MEGEGSVVGSEVGVALGKLGSVVSVCVRVCLCACVCVSVCVCVCVCVGCGGKKERKRVHPRVWEACADLTACGCLVV